MQFIFEQIRVGGDRNLGYLIGDRNAGVAALIDPSYSPEKLLERATVQGLTVTTVLNTHGHHDHVNGNQTVVDAGASLRSFDTLQDGETLSFGEIDLQIIFTPGHSPDHICIYCPQYNTVCTGDHLFVGKIGGTPTDDTARQQYASLQKLYETMPPETTVWPGHDYGCRPSSTLALEKATNPFLLVESFEEFLELKGTWSAFKKKHGLL